jgi:hypothetical protein
MKKLLQPTPPQKNFKLTWHSRASECIFCETVPRPARWYPLSFPWQHVVEAQTRANVPATQKQRSAYERGRHTASREFAHTRTQEAKSATHFKAKARLVTQFAEAAKVSERLLMVAAHVLGVIYRSRLLRWVGRRVGRRCTQNIRPWLREFRTRRGAIFQGRPNRKAEQRANLQGRIGQTILFRCLLFLPTQNVPSERASQEIVRIADSPRE